MSKRGLNPRGKKLRTRNRSRSRSRSQSRSRSPITIRVRRMPVGMIGLRNNVEHQNLFELLNQGGNSPTRRSPRRSRSRSRNRSTNRRTRSPTMDDFIRYFGRS